MAGFGGSGERRSFGGKDDCPHNAGWNPASAPAGAVSSRSSGFGPKKAWWACSLCGMTIESASRPQPEDFEPDEGEDDDD